MKPIGLNIVIKSIDEEIKTSSGLLLSSEDANQLRYKKGRVVKPGTDVSVIADIL
jgi:co-chaperonin GroES (HSP10)